MSQTSISTESSPSSPWLDGLKDDYHAIFVDTWSPYLGAVLILLAVIGLMITGFFWGTFGGFRLWGDYLNSALGLGGLLGITSELDHPLLHRISLTNIALILGALSAAMLSRQFRFDRPPAQELAWGAAGGTLMGIGASLAGGCTVGGFYIPLLYASAAGWSMLVGLIIGAYIGLKVLLWGMEHISWGTDVPARTKDSVMRSWLPLVGLIIALLILAWAAQWYQSDDKLLSGRAVIIVCGFCLGFILHRSRFCFARVFREPFMTAEGEMTKAMILAMLIGIPVTSLLIQKQLIDPYAAVPAAFWIGSLSGAVIFGIGMVFAGGCATGSMWRAAEGHVKLWIALFFFAWSGSLTSGVLKKTGLSMTDIDIDFMDGIPEISALGYQAFLPDMLQGWGWTYLLCFAGLVLWYLLVRYNESTERFTVL